MWKGWELQEVRCLLIGQLLRRPLPKKSSQVASEGM
ncbi:hypothetical protein ACHAXR_003124 [Thalassiosira sp. AJA248-18]